MNYILEELQNLFPRCLYNGHTYYPGQVVELYKEVCMQAVCTDEATITAQHIPDCKLDWRQTPFLAEKPVFKA